MLVFLWSLCQIYQASHSCQYVWSSPHSVRPTLIFNTALEDKFLTFSMALMDLGYVAVEGQWFLATVYLMQFKFWLLSDLWSSIHHQRTPQGAETEGYRGEIIYTQLLSGEDMSHSQSTREQEQETVEKEVSRLGTKPEHWRVSTSASETLVVIYRRGMQYHYNHLNESQNKTRVLSLTDCVVLALTLGMQFKEKKSTASKLQQKYKHDRMCILYNT